MLKHFGLAAALLLVPVTGFVANAADPATLSVPAPQERLSPAALETLVSGIALYPDPLVEQILLASQYPLALHHAAEELNGTLPREVAALAAASSTESVDYLKQYPEVLLQLNEQLALTARLGVAFREQPRDVWNAVAAVRAAYEDQAASEEAAASSGGASSGGGAYPAYGGFVARRLLAASAIHELNEYRYDQSTNANSTMTTSTIVGPNGQSATVTGGGVAGQTTVGDTTYFGAAAGGTATGPQGQSVSGAGSVKGSATQTENGVQVQTQASGAYSASNGASGQGTRDGSTTATQNADGSTSWNHSASGGASGTNGSGNYTHTGGGTATGDGSGAYHGETTVNANGNSVSTETDIGGGQGSTTVTNSNTGNSNTYTAGDGQIENAPSGSSDSANSSRSRQSPDSTSTQQGAKRDWSQMNRAQISQASQAMKQSWGQLGSQIQGGSVAQRTGVRAQKAGATSKKLSSGATGNGTRKSKLSSPQRQTQSAPNRSSSPRGGGGGGRGGRGGRR